VRYEERSVVLRSGSRSTQPGAWLPQIFEDHKATKDAFPNTLVSRRYKNHGFLADAAVAAHELPVNGHSRSVVGAQARETLACAMAKQA
jgi:hypothetical protein